MDKLIYFSAILLFILSFIESIRSQYYSDSHSSTTTRSGLASYTVTSCGPIETPPLKWTEQNIPNPQVDTCKCGRNGKTSWVCNPNNLITDSEANQVDAAIEKLRSSTGSCHCGAKECSHVPHGYGGYQAAVVLLSALYVKPGDSAKETADDFTDHLRDDMWEFGACNDDLVILISDQDRVVYTATGEVTRQVVSDKCVNDITDNNKKYLGNKMYAQALTGMVEEYTQALNKEHPCNKPLSGWQLFTVVGGIVVGLGACALCVFLRKRCGFCRARETGYDVKYHAGRRGSHDSHVSAKSASSGGGGDTF